MITMACIISSDDIKESLAGYDPGRAEELHKNIQTFPSLLL
jgi:hypothetical protein